MAPEPASSVLIVDDENGVRDLMTRWLETGGLSSRACNAEEALGRLDTRPGRRAL
jgi:CheY-like chemotaxis protein